MERLKFLRQLRNFLTNLLNQQSFKHQNRVIKNNNRSIV